MNKHSLLLIDTDTLETLLHIAELEGPLTADTVFAAVNASALTADFTSYTNQQPERNSDETEDVHPDSAQWLTDGKLWPGSNH